MKAIKSTMLCLAMLLVSSAVLSQEWSDEQKEVWSFVESYSKAYEDGNYEKFMSVFHEDYKGWSYQAVVPMSKEAVGKYVEMGMKGYDHMLSNRTPVSIQVYDDFAVVNYLFHGMSKNKSSGEVKESAGRWTDILMKDGNQWYLIADHGGEYPDDDD